MVLEVLSHEFMHLVTAAVAIILFVIALLSYLQKRSVKFLFITAAFLVFAIKEVILVSFDPTAAHLTTHSLNLVILVLFAIGILK